MLKQTLTVAALAAALATPAFAQGSTTPNAQTPAPMTSPSQGAATFIQQQQATDWRSSKLVGAGNL